MSVVQYGRKFPVLLTMQNPRGQVELIETIGKGNYGNVYRAKLTKTNEIAAVKVVFLKEDEIKETLLEMEILERCKHENITRYFGCYLKGLDLWIAMEFCGAGAVDSIYRALKKPLPEDTIASIIYESVLALEYLHTKVGLIHRDIKSGNLLLTLDGKVKLADFGVSAQLKQIGGSANTFIGTPYWMAPEVIMCDPDNTKSQTASYTDKSDIWSIGITAIEIAEKNPPLSDIHPMQALNLIPKSNIGLSKPKNFSKQLVDFISFCLEKNPQKRPSATECLKHPFLAAVATLDRSAILTNLVDKVQNIREKKKAGIEIVDEDEDFSKDQLPPKVIADTIKNAQRAQESLMQQEAGFQGHVQQEFAPAPSFNEFPRLENKIQDGISAVFEPVVLTTLTTEVNTAAFLDGQYILLGTERGLAYLNIMKPAMKIPVILIHNVRFKQIDILPDYNAMIGLSGKHDQIRQYNLSSVRRLILYNEGNAAHVIAKTDTTVALPDAILGGNDPQNEYSYLHREDNVDEATLVSRWTNDFIKIVGTRDTKEFYVEQTESTAFLITFGTGIVLFRWAAEPYKKFMKIKEFWVPELPKFVSFAQDGLEITDIFLGYSSELNRVSVATSKVTTINTHKEMKTKGFTSTRWQSILQIPYSDAKLSEVLRANARAAGTQVKKLAAVNGPTLKRQPTITQRYFLGTYHRMTKVVDESGIPMIGASVGGWQNGVVWSDPPMDQILRPLQTVISVGKNNIEIVDWKSAGLRQRLSISSAGNFKVFSSKHGQTLIGVEKKKYGILLYWMRENTAPPRAVGSLLAKIVSEQQPSVYSLNANSPVKAQSIETQMNNISLSNARVEAFDAQFEFDKDLPRMPEVQSEQPRYQEIVELREENKRTPSNASAHSKKSTIPKRIDSPISEKRLDVEEKYQQGPKQPSPYREAVTNINTPESPDFHPTENLSSDILNPMPAKQNMQFRPTPPARINSPESFDSRHQRPQEGFDPRYQRPEGYRPPQDPRFLPRPPEGFRPPLDDQRYRNPQDDPRYAANPSFQRPARPYLPQGNPNVRPLPRPDPRYYQGPPPNFNNDPRFRPQHPVDNRNITITGDDHLDARYQQRPQYRPPQDPRSQPRPPMGMPYRPPPPQDPRFQRPPFDVRPPFDSKDDRGSLDGIRTGFSPPPRPIQYDPRRQYDPRNDPRMYQNQGYRPRPMDPRNPERDYRPPSN